MGLPETIITFKTKGQTAMKRSARGIIACILLDDTEGGRELNVYKSILDVDFNHWTKRNFEYLKLIYEGSPSTVLVLRVGTDITDLAPALKKLKSLRWNYLTVPALPSSQLTVVSAWIKEARERSHKIFKAVLPKCVGDHEGIINFTTDTIHSTLSETVFTTAEYCARIAGALAGLPLSRSFTNYAFSDIVSANIPDDPDERIDAGELVLVFDSEKYKVGRGVTSLTTLTAEKSKEFKKIKIVEGVDLYQDDIRSTYDDAYSGRVINDYDHKQAFVAAVITYQKSLQGDVLDKEYDNTASVDVEAQRAYLENEGTDTSGMDDVAVAKANTGSKMFIGSHVKFVDAAEDLYLVCNM